MTSLISEHVGTAQAAANLMLAPPASALAPPAAAVLAPHAGAMRAQAQAGTRRAPAGQWPSLLCGAVLLGGDGIAMAAAVLLSLGLAPPAVPRDLAPPLAAILLYLAAKGRYAERIPFWTEWRLVVSASCLAAVAGAVVTLLTGHGFDTNATILVPLLFAALAAPVNRLAKHALARAGLWTLPVVVVGDGPAAAEAEAALGSDQSLGYHFVARIDPVSVMAESTPLRLRTALQRHRARRLLIAIDGDGALQRQVVECALRERVPFSVAAPSHTFPAFDWDPTRLFSCDTTVLSFRDGLSRPSQRLAKAALDVSLAALLLVLAVPLFLLLAAVIRLDGGPVFYTQRRLGAGGRPFRCLKFRTMVVDSERALQTLLAADPALAAEWQATRKLARDPRITWVGRFLRRTSLDELPQLLNVLRLEMSLVGPRPIVESEVPLYGEHIAHYYAIRPGMTGLWQISGRSSTSYARRVQLDVWYVNNWSVWNDLAVLLKTIPVVIGREGAH